jgi:purine nucleoside permease
LKYSRSLRITLVVVLLLAILSGIASASEKGVEIKMLVLSMFEVGENSGDFAGEFQHWYERYFDGARVFEITGNPNPLYVNSDGVAGTVAGIGKARAAATLTAILSDPRFDLDNTYFMVSGCAGGPPFRTTLGSVVLCNAVVDCELGYSWKESDGKSGESTFMVMDSMKGSAYFELNTELIERVSELVAGIELEDSTRAAFYRLLYKNEEARSRPSVQMGVSVTSDSYWHGKGSSRTADEVCSAYGAGTYMVTQMEDSAFAGVLKAFGKLNRMLVIRDVVNFDQPHPGQTVKESLSTSSGGFSIGMTNGFRVGSAIVDNIVSDWDSWK